MDDLLDLNWTAPSPAPAGNASSKQPGTGKFTPINGSNGILSPNPSSSSGHASFDFLSKPLSAGTPNYYSATPLRGGTPLSAPLGGVGTGPGGGAGGVNGRTSVPPSGHSRSSTPLIPPQSARPTGTPAPNPHAPSSANMTVGMEDAFSSLLSLSANPSKANTAMTMAERQAALVLEKQRKEEDDRKRFHAEGAFWDNLGSSSAAGNSKPLGNAGAAIGGGFDDLLQPAASGSKIPRPPSGATNTPLPSAPPPATAGARAKTGGTFWDNYDDDDEDDLLGGPSKPSTSQPSSSSKANGVNADFMDFDSFSSPSTQLDVPSGHNGTRSVAASASASGSGSGPGSGMRTPVSNFGFGDGVGEHGEDDDDILGDLGKPVQPKTKTQVKSRQAEAGPSSTEKPARPTSPPPHIVGQIVEMGFSPAQARSALANTPTGLDVQAALELLLASQGSSSRGDPDALGEADDDHVERERARREEAEKERRRRRRAGPTRESVQPRTSQLGAERDDVPDVLAQAADIGQNFMKQATAFWNTGKEKAAKIYEEKRKAYEANAAGAAGNPGGDGGVRRGKERPKWMADAENGWDESPERNGGGGFRDDDADSPPRADGRSARAAGNSSSNGAASKPQTSVRRPQEFNEVTTKEANLLFADEEPNPRASASRPSEPPAAAQTQPRPLSRTPAKVPASAPSVPRPTRQLVPATPAQVQTSAAHKAKGNEHFKLGRFAEAATAYTSAISSLPEGHLFLVPLHNNRAAARLKLGESGAAAEDCTAVITLIGPSYHPNKEAALPADLVAEVKLSEGLVKATIKRAQALEMGEKWQQALEDWERVLAFDGALLGNTATNSRKLASEGARRARKMVNGEAPNGSQPSKPSTTASSTSESAYKPPPRPRPAPSVASKPKREITIDNSQAVAELRKAALAAEAEEDERFRLKDTVDTRINAWKGGKETNLRALIASLDTVLWEEILSGGLKVGMHELVMDKQVKVKYMKVIARLHPDKLNTSNTTVEQRMLANAAFGALSEAWQAFNR